MKKVALAIVAVLATASVSFAGLTYTTLDPGAGDGFLHYQADFTPTGATEPLWTADVQEVANAYDSGWVNVTEKNPDYATFHVTLRTTTPNGMSTLVNIAAIGDCYQVKNFTQSGPNITLHNTPTDESTGNPADAYTVGDITDTRILVNRIASYSSASDGVTDAGLHTEDNDGTLGTGPGLTGTMPTVGFGSLYGAMTPRWTDTMTIDYETGAVLSYEPDEYPDVPSGWKDKTPEQWATEWLNNETPDQDGRLYSYSTLTSATAYAINSPYPVPMKDQREIEFLQVTVSRVGLMVPTGDEATTDLVDVSGLFTNYTDALARQPLVPFSFAVGAVPEPSTIIMLVLGALCLVGARFRRK